MNAAEVPPTPPAFKRTLGVGEVTASGVGIIIGAGIYVLIGEAAGLAGNGAWLGFLLAAVLSALSGLSYAELASMYPRASAEYEFTRHALAEWVAFAVGWVMIGGLAIASAAVSIGFSRYLGSIIDVPEMLAALLLVAACAGLALAGIESSIKVTVLLSCIQVGGLLLVIALGARHVGDVDLFDTKGTSGVIGAAALVFFAFIGFDEVITLSEETKDPVRTIPLALMLALGISVVLYISVAIVAVSVLDADVLAASDRPIADVVDEVASGGFPFIIAAALISTANTTLLALTSASRMIYGMATSGALPPLLGEVSRRTRAPWAAVLGAVTVTVGFVLVGDLRFIASVTDAAIYSMFLAVNASVIILRFREPKTPRPFRTPFAIGKVPLVPVAGFISAGFMMTRLTWEALALLGVVILIGIAVRPLLDNPPVLRARRG